MVRRKKIGMWMLALTVAALTSPLLMFPQQGKSQKIPNLELRLQPGKLVNGVPESFTFVFVNISNHDVRMPQPSLCADGVFGWLYLGLELKPTTTEVGGFGCGGGIGGSGHVIAMRDQAKNWKILKPGESLKVSFPGIKLFSTKPQQVPGTYDFWATYTPPIIPAYDQQILTEEGIDFPRSHLVSPHLTFVRKK